MSVDSVRAYLCQYDLQTKVLEFPVSSATVEEAAAALRCEERRIAKTMSFLVDGHAALIVMAGDARVDNVKFKEHFRTKAVMLKGDEVEALTGHPVGGVCPFAVPEGARVYLDRSLQRFDTVFPACGSRNSAIELTPAQLQSVSRSAGWVDVGKGWEEITA